MVGLGNPILGDDGVGWRVVEEVSAQIGVEGRLNKAIEFEYYSLGGLSLMERMEGYKDVIVVDSILTKSHPNGTIYSVPLSGLPDFSYGHTTAIHDASLATALEMGHKMGLVLPVYLIGCLFEALPYLCSDFHRYRTHFPPSFMIFLKAFKSIHYG